MIDKVKVQTPNISNNGVGKEEDLAYNDKKRKDNTKRHINIAFIVVIYIALVVFVCLLLARSWHLGAPDNLNWLSEPQLQNIDKLIYSGAIGGFIGRYFQSLG